MIAFIIIENWDKVDGNMHVAALRKNRCSGSKWGAENKTVTKNVIIQRLSCKSKYKICRKLGAPAAAQKGK